jgi:predicted nucleotidyltransferase
MYQEAQCPWCGQPTVETYSEKRAVMDPQGDGYQRIHVTAYRVGDGAPLGKVECEPGQSGWGI